MKTDDDFLQELSAAAKRSGLAGSTGDARFEALCQDTQLPDFGVDFTEQVVDRIAAELEGSPRAKVVSLMSWRARRTLWLGMSLTVAAAAAAVFVFITPMRVTPLPPYALESSTGSLAVRGQAETSPALRLVRGTRLELVARPQESLSGDWQVQAYAIVADRAVLLRAPLERKDNGSVRLVGEVGSDLVLSTGTQWIWLAIGRPGLLPSPEQLLDWTRGTDRVERPGLVLLGKQVDLKE